MRRGHPGIGGWRNENTRFFRPRSGGTSHFRPPRGFGQLEPPRFPPPGIRPPRAKSPAPFNSRSATLIGNNGPGYHGRMKYRVDNRPNVQRPSDRGHYKAPRANYPVFQRMRMSNPNYPNQFQEHRFHEDIEIEPCRVNSMGDIDHRQLLISKDQESYNQNQHHHQAPPWTSHIDKHSFYDNKTYNSKSYQHENDSNKLPMLDYIGHRPPASDHYGGNPGSAVDSANSFSRSVDDTVDIVRKRLLNRNDTHQHSTDQIVDRSEDQGVSNPESSDYQNTQDLPTKKRTQRQRISNIKTNCDKIKNNIVHQLFKMDKDKIHKLMDNPNSSTKFEYAISSLITESQNSLNKHLRSVAEKSLTSSSDFIHNDNNTIYEDTFMKQMQCILDPQDTVFLEDIKPLVMAELSKALQVDDYYTHQYDNADNQDNCYYHRGDTPGLEHSSHTPYHYDNYVNEIYFEGNESPHNYENKEHSQIPVKVTEDFKFDPGDYIDRSIFERRKARISRDHDKERQGCIDTRRLSRMSVDETSDLRFETSDKNSNLSRRSIDGKPYEETPTSEPTVPLFDTYGDLLSDDEDPFAGLDQQYHVDVDPNFIQTSDSSPQPSFINNESKSPIKKEVVTNFQTPEKHLNNFNEIEDQSQIISKSPLRVTSNEQISNTIPKIHIDQEICNLPLIQPSANNNFVFETSASKQEHNPQYKEAVKPVANSENLSSTVKSSTPDARKRSQDQRPSHRKEKRKKSESDSNQQILNKNIIINVNDCAAKELEKCTETAKSIFNLYFSKDEHSKEPSNTSSKTESIEKSYSDKYVKRKEQPITSKEKQTETKRRHRSSSSSHSKLSPKDNSNKSSSSNQNIKADPAKTKLTDINIFMEQPRKVASAHQAHRNSAVTIKTPEKTISESQTKIHTSLKIVKPIYIKKLLSKETQTKFNEKAKKTTRFTQTNKKKLSSKFVQTDPVVFAKSGPKATEAFERMKEIDLEIQVLLQEKFKIYSSLESKNPCPNTMQTLGMTVLNVSQFEDDVPETETGTSDMNEDSIVAEFTNIPVEELEQIALESIQTLKIESAEPQKNEKKQCHQKTSDQGNISSMSPIYKGRKTKAPNISLLEQIITDDRPIEDIISLDALESSPVIKRLRKQPSKYKPKKNKNRKAKASKSVCNMDYKLKQCYVLLNRNEFNDYFRKKAVKLSACDDIVIVDNVMEPIVIHSEESNDGRPEINAVGRLEVIVDTNSEESVQSNPERNIEQQIVMEETVMNDIHFDMLDVSEDIVIGDVCEVKSSGDKDVNERMEVPVCEEIILDNSQSSMEEGVTAETSLADNQCKMYDYSTDENLRRDTVTITGNADAVLAIECVENNFLAACLDGNVYYFSGDGQLLTMLRGSNLAVTCLTIVKEKYGTTVYTGSLDSRIRYYDLETGLEKGPECNVLSPIQTMDRAWDTVFVGTRTGFVLQFECKNNMLIPVSTVKFSEQSILALRALKEGPRKVLLVAARSEDVTIKDAQTGLLLRTLFGPKMTVYTLLYEDGKVYCGTSSHQIHVFDYASGSHNGVHEGGKGAVCLRATGGLLFAGCYDGCVYVYREGEPRPLAQLRGPSVMLLSLAVVGSKIIAGYKDRGLYIWKIPLAILQEMIL